MISSESFKDTRLLSRNPPTMCSSILKQILVELNIFTSKLIILLCKIRDLRGLKIAYLKAFYSLFNTCVRIAKYKKAFQSTVNRRHSNRCMGYIHVYIHIVYVSMW